MADIKKDLKDIARMNERLTTGFPKTFDKKPVFLSFRKLDRFHYEKQREQEETAARYGLPAWRKDPSWLAEALDAFDAQAIYPLVKHVDTIDEKTARRALVKYIKPLNDKKKRNKRLELLDAFIERADETLDFPAKKRFRYMVQQAELMKAMPAIELNIDAIAMLLGDIEQWHRPGSAATDDFKNPAPALSRFRHTFDRVLSEEDYKSICTLREQWVYALRRFQQEIQWAGVIAMDYLPPKKGKRVDHEGPIGDWGARLLRTHLLLWYQTHCIAEQLGPLVDIAIAYRDVFIPYSAPKRSLFFDVPPMNLRVFSPDEQKKRRKEQAAAEPVRKSKVDDDDFIPMNRNVVFDDDDWAVRAPYTPGGNFGDNISNFGSFYNRGPREF